MSTDTFGDQIPAVRTQVNFEHVIDRHIDGWQVVSLVGRVNVGRRSFAQTPKREHCWPVQRGGA